jgi:hypothetical protein
MPPSLPAGPVDRQTLLMLPVVAQASPPPAVEQGAGPEVTGLLHVDQRLRHRDCRRRHRRSDRRAHREQGRAPHARADRPGARGAAPQHRAGRRLSGISGRHSWVRSVPYRPGAGRRRRHRIQHGVGEASALALARRRESGRAAVGRQYGVAIAFWAAAAFSHRSWEGAATFDAREDWRHSIAAPEWGS